MVLITIKPSRILLNTISLYYVQHVHLFSIRNLTMNSSTCDSINRQISVIGEKISGVSWLTRELP
jgi:uncharacterized protein with HEPN domain